MLTAPERRARARVGGFARSALYDGHEVVASARAAFEDKFRQEVLAAAAERGEQLGEAEIERRSIARLRAHMAKLALRSVRARARRRAAEARE